MILKYLVIFLGLLCTTNIKLLVKTQHIEYLPHFWPMKTNDLPYLEDIAVTWAHEFYWCKVCCCPRVYLPICATDNLTYTNACHFKCYQIRHPWLNWVVYSRLGMCFPLGYDRRSGSLAVEDNGLEQMLEKIQEYYVDFKHESLYYLEELQQSPIWKKYPRVLEYVTSVSKYNALKKQLADYFRIVKVHNSTVADNSTLSSTFQEINDLVQNSTFIERDLKKLFGNFNQ